MKSRSSLLLVVSVCLLAAWWWSPYLTLRWKLFSALHAPIRFYGKVVDQHGKPVPEAQVLYSALNSWRSSAPPQHQITADSEGTFAITDEHGYDLGVSVSKEGYRLLPPLYGNMKSSGSFEYGNSPKGPHQSSKEAPTVFTLHKVGELEPLVKIGDRFGGKSFRIARDGSPLSISLDQKGGHMMILRCWNKDLERPEGRRKYDWRLEITVPGGGMVARKDALQFYAPEEGYTSGETVDMSVSLTGEQWRSFAERSYFIRFDDGTFARAEMEMRAGGDHLVVWKSFFNPQQGSQNLENDLSK